jgi:hypothetical protein
VKVTPVDLSGVAPERVIKSVLDSKVAVLSLINRVLAMSEALCL